MRRADAGASLAEVLVATAVLSLVMAALLQFALLTSRVVQAQGDLADTSQRGRVALALLHRDLLTAGAGPWHGAQQGSVAARLPAVLPGRRGARNADPELTAASDRLSVLFVPDARVQTRLTADMAGAGAPLVIDAAAPGCPTGGACGFRAGDRALIVGPAAGAYDLFTVSASGAGMVTAAVPLSAIYPAGSAVATVVERVYYLDRATRRLMLYDGAQSDAVLLDNVRDLRFTYFGTRPENPSAWSLLTAAELSDGPVLGAAPFRFDADLLRIRRIRIQLTLDPPGGFVAVGGWRGGRTLTLDVTPRNLGGAE